MPPSRRRRDKEKEGYSSVCFAECCFPGCLAIDTPQPHNSLLLTRALFQITTKAPLLTQGLGRDAETNANSEIKLLSPGLPKRTGPENGSER